MTVMKIQCIIDKYDPQGLLRQGAPGDEYRSEAQMILSNLESRSSFNECLDLVYSVFYSMFGSELVGDKQSYFPMAEEIWKRKTDKWND